MKHGPAAGWRWWVGAVAGAALGVTGWLLLRDSREADGPLRLSPLRRRIASMAGPGRVRVRRLGDGIVELVGRIDDPDLEGQLLDEAAAVEGVEVVVDRLWGGDGSGRDRRKRPIDAPSGRR